MIEAENSRYFPSFPYGVTILLTIVSCDPVLASETKGEWAGSFQDGVSYLYLHLPPPFPFFLLLGIAM